MPVAQRKSRREHRTLKKKGLRRKLARKAGGAVGEHRTLKKKGLRPRAAEGLLE